MSLYDGLGIDTGPSKKDTSAGEKKGDVSGWSAGIKMMQSHLRMKKAALTEAQRKMKQPILPPVVDLKKVPGPGPGPGPGSTPGPSSSSRSASSGGGLLPGPFEERGKSSLLSSSGGRPTLSMPKTAVYMPASLGSDGENEYDPAYPNEYEKVAKKLRERRDREREEQERKEREERRRRRERDRDRDRERDRDRDRDRRDRDRDRDREREPQGFSRRPPSDDEEDDKERERRRSATTNRAAIAPPSSLINSDSHIKDDEFAAPLPPTKDRPYAEMMRRKNQGQDDPEGAKTPPRISEFAPPPEQNPFVKPSAPKLNFQPPIGLGADSVAAKIMAKYGFKEGAGLGKSEQGISTALQVEKTSRRGGKIINKDKEAQDEEPPARFTFQEPSTSAMPPPPMPPPPVPKAGPVPITDVLKNPTKILLLTNMVGPGEVDDDLQPETAEECSKYGEVVKVLIYEDPLKTPNEAVRIFVEFTRVESAVKAVVDMNGRFFGGRIVKASFYSVDKFAKFELTA